MSAQNQDKLSSEVGEQPVRIKIIGVGGAGCNAVDRLRIDNEQGVDLAVVNTDAQALASSPVDERLMIGRKATRGLSCGGDADLGQKVAEHELETLRQCVSGFDLVFVLAGLGGGTGSGGAPVIARLASEQGAVVMAMVTKPFTLEGERRLRQSVEALDALRKTCDAVIPLPNDLLMQHMEEAATMLDAFAQADRWISRGVRAICMMLVKSGLINLDFAALRNVFCPRGGKTLFGLGKGEGDDRLSEALADLELCPLLHTPELTRRADRLLVNIIGGPELSMAHVNRIMTFVTEKFGSAENTAFGAVIDESLSQQIEICVIGASGGKGTAANQRPSKKKQQTSQKDKPMAAPVAMATARQLVHESKLGKRQADLLSEEAQEEFMFVADDEQRGYFDETERNLFEGQDLDVPTYLRRGIQVAL